VLLFFTLKIFFDVSMFSSLTPLVGIMTFLFEFFLLWYIVYYHDEYLSQIFFSWDKIKKSYGLSRYTGHYVTTVTNGNISRKTQAFEF
jgi:hypothetical protein